MSLSSQCYNYVFVLQDQDETEQDGACAIQEPYLQTQMKNNRSSEASEVEEEDEDEEDGQGMPISISE